MWETGHVRAKSIPQDGPFYCARHAVAPTPPWTRHHATLTRGRHARMIRHGPSAALRTVRSHAACTPAPHAPPRVEGRHTRRAGQPLLCRVTQRRQARPIGVARNLPGSRRWRGARALGALPGRHGVDARRRRGHAGDYPRRSARRRLVAHGGTATVYRPVTHDAGECDTPVMASARPRALHTERDTA